MILLWIKMVITFTKSEHRKIELQDKDLTRNGGVFFRYACGDFWQLTVKFAFSAITGFR
jgi:hypothetical protein